MSSLGLASTAARASPRCRALARGSRTSEICNLAAAAAAPHPNARRPMFARANRSARALLRMGGLGRRKRDEEFPMGRFVISSSALDSQGYGGESLQKKVEVLERQLQAEKAKTARLQGMPSNPEILGESKSYNGVFLILLLNVALYAIDHIFHLPIRGLYLNHAHPHWWQFVTSSFCHANWAHLSSNLFFLYIFGKLVEEEEGTGGVLATYLITGVGASLASFLLMPKMAGGAIMMSLGASGAVFGLFAVSVLVKLSFSVRKLLEVGILGQFVMERLVNEVGMQASGGKVIGGLSVNHIAHIAGAAAGVLLIFLLSRIDVPDEEPKRN